MKSYHGKKNQVPNIAAKIAIEIVDYADTRESGPIEPFGPTDAAFFSISIHIGKKSDGSATVIFSFYRINIVSRFTRRIWT